MARKRRLLILGPSFRRNKSGNSLPAIERYDGLFFRIARKYLSSAKDVDVVVMIDDLTLVDGSARLPYSEPEGKHWGGQRFLKDIVERAKVKNQNYLEKRFRRREYSEVFISMGKVYAAALPDFTQYDVRVTFPKTGGPGPKAQALKEWLNPERRHNQRNRYDTL